MKARIEILLKDGVLDPQGKAIETALGALGFESAKEVRQGKLIELDVDAASEDEARQKAEEMCQKLLANPVMERYRIDISPS